MGTPYLLDQLSRQRRSREETFDYTILLPTWNNLAFLQLCVQSLRRHSTLHGQVIVMINDGSDGTLEWVRAQEDLDFIHAPQNIGICYGLNACRPLIRSEYVIYLNDDMYVLPGWDQVLVNTARSMETKAFMLSATMIEPVKVNNPSSCAVVGNYGTSVADFREEALVAEFQSLARADWAGSTWPPNLVHLDLWDLVGGMSIEFSPGMYSDPDFSRKLYASGVRQFRGLGQSLVYHFGEKSTRRINKNPGRRMFLMKWGITARTFFREYLEIGSEYKGPVRPHKLSAGAVLLSKLKQIMSVFEKSSQ